MQPLMLSRIPAFTILYINSLVFGSTACSWETQSITGELQRSSTTICHTVGTDVLLHSYITTMWSLDCSVTISCQFCINNLRKDQTNYIPATYRAWWPFFSSDTNWSSCKNAKQLMMEADLSWWPKTLCPHRKQMKRQLYGRGPWDPVRVPQHRYCPLQYRTSLLMDEPQELTAVECSFFSCRRALRRCSL